MNASNSAFIGEIVDSDDTARLTRTLLDKNALSTEAHRELLGAELGRSRISLRQILEASDISAHDLADEIAAHYHLPPPRPPGVTERDAPRSTFHAPLFA